MRAREVRPQLFSRLQLMRLDQGTPVASAPPRQPDQRAFRFIDGDAGAAKVGGDLPFSQRKMLSTKAINGRLLRLRATRRFSPFAAAELPAAGSGWLRVGHRQCPV